MQEGFATAVEIAWFQPENKTRVMQSRAAALLVRCTLDLEGDTEPVELHRSQPALPPLHASGLALSDKEGHCAAGNGALSAHWYRPNISS